MNKKIFFVAPSFGVTTSPYKERFKESLKIFKKLGFEYQIGENVYMNKSIASSNTPELRAKEIMDAFNSDSDIIWSVGGGEVMVEILEYLDFTKLKNKTYIGFSDNTNLTYTLATINDMETIYGVNAPGFCYLPLEYESLDTYRMINNEKLFKTYKEFVLNDLDETPIHKYVCDNKAKIKAINYNEPVSGRIIGGCLDCLVTLCGTKYDNTIDYINKHKDEGIIFFMEACDLNSISLKRALIQLKYAGWFDNVDMFIIGRSNNYFDKSFGLSMKDSYISVLKDFNKPILLDASISHIGPSLPVKVGGYVTVTYNRNQIKFEYK